MQGESISYLYVVGTRILRNLDTEIDSYICITEDSYGYLGSVNTKYGGELTVMRVCLYIQTIIKGSVSHKVI